MRVSVDYGLAHLEVDIPQEKLVGVQQQPPAPRLTILRWRCAGAGVASGFSGSAPGTYAEDHVAIVVDDRLPHVADLLAPIVEH